jgi:hypothetical protein
MLKVAVTGWIFALASLPALFAQSIVFVSPSTKGVMSMACAGDTLGSFEQVHYLAAAHYLADHLCAQTHIDGGVGLWNGQAENSGMIDGCPGEKARVLGAMLGRYYHQKAALVFDRDAAGKSWLVSFHATQPLGVVSILMSQAKITGATVIPHDHDNLIFLVAGTPEDHARSQDLYTLMHGQGLHEEQGTVELIGNSEDRAKARDVYDGILARSTPEVHELNEEMYTSQFEDLGMQ